MADLETVRELLTEALLLVRWFRSGNAYAANSRGIGTGERSVLQILEEDDGITVPQIARAGFSTRQNVQVVVNRLAAKGMVRLAVNPDHRKSPIIRITEAGRGRLAQAGHNSDNTLRAKLGALEESEVRKAIDCLRRAREMISENAGLVPSTKALKAEPIGSEPLKRKPEVKQRQPEGGSRATLQADETELPVSLL